MRPWTLCLGATALLSSLAFASPPAPRAAASPWHLRASDPPGVQGGCGPSGHRRCLALTFDDGPDYHTTPRLLEQLASRHLRATFFVVGHRLDGDDDYHQRNRAVLRDIAARGHELGNHSFHHVVLDGLSPAQFSFEVDRTEALIQRTLGRRARYLRAPFGALRTRRAVEGVYARGYTHVPWDLDTMDWSVRSAAAVAGNFRQVLRFYPRGGVVLMHDTHAWSVSAFPLVLAAVEHANRELLARGEVPYEIVGLEELVQSARPNAPSVPSAPARVAPAAPIRSALRPR